MGFAGLDGFEAIQRWAGLMSWARSEREKLGNSCPTQEADLEWIQEFGPDLVRRRIACGAIGMERVSMETDGALTRYRNIPSTREGMSQCGGDINNA